MLDSRDESLTGFVQQSRLHPLIDSVFSLDDVAQAHARVDTGHKRGAVVVRVGLETPETAG